MTDLQASEVGRIAKRLTKAQRAWLTDRAEWRAPALGHEPRWMTFPPMNTFEVLCSLGLVDRAGQIRDLGLAVRKHLEGGL